MKGYLSPLAPGPEERALFRSYQCGLCHAMESEFGFRYRLFAQPDVVFLNVLLDRLSAAGPAPVGRRACPLGPVVTRNLPVRAKTENTRVAAAFGVYMAVEKLRDDWQDDGGWLRWLAWRAFRPGHARARTVLEAAGFPVARVEEEMAAQAEIERGGALAVEDAARPTAAIARSLFAFAAREADPVLRGRVAAIGERVGGFLFYMDNLLDLPRDLAAGGYNALARAAGLRKGDAVPDAVRQVGIDGARRQVAELRRLVPGLADGAWGRFLEKTLIDGFADKLARYRALPEAARARAGLRSVQPRAVPLGQRLARVWAKTEARLRVSLALAVLAVFPRAAWAERVLVADATDTGLPPEGIAAAVDTGVDTGASGTRTAWDDFVEACYCQDECGDCCDDACGSVCDDVCDDVCDVSCGDSCGSACD